MQVQLYAMMNSAFQKWRPSLRKRDYIWTPAGEENTKGWQLYLFKAICEWSTGEWKNKNKAAINHLAFVEIMHDDLSDKPFHGVFCLFEISLVIFLTSTFF